ncbi:hypothetical protein MKX01_001119 [Papaver californicum]|nr:hypothetical protein MKX01_001119 [Papaver californicum]
MKGIRGYGLTDQVSKPSLDNFNVDILCEILSRVPTRSLVWSCKFVCKRWLSLIRSPHFVESHRIQAKTRQPSLIIRTTDRDQKTELFFVDESSFEDSRAFNATVLMSFTDKGHMLRVPSSGLLFCLIDSKRHSVRICNPWTGEITPSIGRRIAIEGDTGVSHRVVATYGFGFDPSTKKHKVVRVWNIRRILNCTLGVAVNVWEVLTVGEDDTWRKIDELPACIWERVPAVSVNGTIYWIKGSYLSWLPTVTKFEALVSFDVGSETCREIPIPKLLEKSFKIQLLEVDGCIAILEIMCDFELKLWIFNGNWTEEIISMPSYWDGSCLHHNIQHIPGTDIIILRAKRTDDADFISLYHYDRKKKTFEKVKINGLPALMMTHTGRLNTMPSMEYTFFTMSESLYPVQKQQQS